VLHGTAVILDANDFSDGTIVEMGQHAQVPLTLHQGESVGFAKLKNNVMQ
jgi:hypothetical protein